MRREIVENELTQVAGGRYWINANTERVAWDNIEGSYQLQNCSVYDAEEAMDGLIGKYRTQAEYDQACYELLDSKGWIVRYK